MRNGTDWYIGVLYLDALARVVQYVVIIKNSGWMEEMEREWRLSAGSSVLILLVLLPGLLLSADAQTFSLYP